MSSKPTAGRTEGSAAGLEAGATTVGCDSHANCSSDMSGRDEMSENDEAEEAEGECEREDIADSCEETSVDISLRKRERGLGDELRAAVADRCEDTRYSLQSDISGPAGARITQFIISHVARSIVHRGDGMADGINCGMQAISTGPVQYQLVIILAWHWSGHQKMMMRSKL
ncbi:hypothetical protein FB45DRAFT_868423 [Roridomyces roridus]|uniref:Uncharacterized protein n=1 Tax=Roridomyces roridus TaxID=1738132 RepID=A0AAD7BPU2_9AGAR|nr:hypothetical protein FB45DRAFT_868423 [Roridomyces roridus]